VACGSSSGSDASKGGAAAAKAGAGGMGASAGGALGTSGSANQGGGQAGAGRPSAMGGGSGSGTAGRGGTTGSSGAGVGASGAGGVGATGGSGSSAGAAGDGAGTGGISAPTGCDDPGFDPVDFATVYDVGPGLDYETPSDVPWEAIAAGTLVRIHHRTEPYRDKWVVSTTGTAEQPVVVLGVPENGELPIITGEDATTRSALDFWNEDRGIIKVGGASSPGGAAAFVTVECLDVQRARPGTAFSAADGSTGEYAEDAACVYLEEGQSITVRNNLIHGCGNGIFASSGSSEVLIASNYVYDNGISGSQYEHNSYTEAAGITFEFNHYGPLCADCDGNNLKDRSAGTVIRYNWIESGSRQLDLVESDHAELVSDPRYGRTFVYGNVLVEPDNAGNSQILHYGGDGGNESMYRKGRLYFYQNTVVSTRNGNTTLFRLSTEEESVSAMNNVFSVTASADTLAISAGSGSVTLSDNWLPQGWVDSHDTLTGSIDDQGNVLGDSPGFSDPSGQDFTLLPSSACVNGAPSISGESVYGYAVVSEYVKHQSGQARPMDGMPDIGAFERE